LSVAVNILLIIAFVMQLSVYNSFKFAGSCHWKCETYESPPYQMTWILHCGRSICPRKSKLHQSFGQISNENIPGGGGVYPLGGVFLS